MSGQDSESDLPVWRREQIFPEKPPGAPYGVLLGKGQARAFYDFGELEAHLGRINEPAGLIWTPERERCFPPEEDARLLTVLRKRKAALSEMDWGSSRFRAFLFALPIIYFLWQALAEGRLFRSQELGIFAVLWLMFAGIPAYEAWKRTRRARRLNAATLADEAEEVRFEIWIRRQHIPATKTLMGMLVGVYLVQALKGLPQSGSLLNSLWFPFATWNGELTLAGLPEAGLVKSMNGIGYFHGESWRLLTAPLLHGQLLHIVMNGLGLLYLGRRTEVMAGWPHFALVFLVSMIAGGMASAHGLPEHPSVGASGGIMGLLGFVLTFEYLHGKLVPQRATRRLIAAVVFTFVVGFVGYNFIDNWAHGGGLLAGAVYAAIVFPKSSSAHRPRATTTDRILGVLAGLVVIGGAILAVIRMRGF
ncbi:rhomboid family intramembrane serine protease [Roseibacillus ishigakijimensis]|uniref:Rhomboid family intramembrane serine protease n=1 Tax=Roseibacillus ishigakijimensis TaxID=454146 RepID=A0A934RSY4_9BACT|nr:rhomboid family intramembrane serine protease [Roseibacillus ishigakijimensis]MBK1833931.1 rhomboid family intramembrane serine protease [Roseibacillus ishigakijimensis]